MQRPTWFFVLLTGGCAWVSDADIAALKPDVDDDGDGAINRNDCAPDDPSISPAKPEIWYDGIDQNCDGANDFDQDGDGFDGVDAGGNDCNDQDARIKPGQSDPFYDGVDRDCDGAPDFDQDGDGYNSDNYADETGVVGDDCVDQASDTPFDVDPALVNPGAIEVWYDGVDQNCDGADDADQDGDGFPCVDGVDENSSCDADCDDTRADVNQRSVEVWYDGVNQDCSTDPNDYDQDGDGYDAAPAGNDCEDLDDRVYPLAVEVVGDGLDSDCDGDDSSASAWSLREIMGLSWVAPARPMLVDSSAYVALTVSVGSLGSEAATYYDGVVSLTWPRATAASSSPSLPIPSSGNIFNLTAGSSDSATLTPTGAHHSVSGSAVIYDIVGVASASTPSFSFAAVSASGSLRATPAQVQGDPGPGYDSVVIGSDGTYAWLVGCASTTGDLTYVSYALSSSTIDTYETLDAGARVCAGGVSDGSFWIYTSDSNVTSTWTLEDNSGVVSLIPAATYSRSASDLRMPEASQRLLLLVDAGADEVVVVDEAGSETIIAPGMGASKAYLAEDETNGAWYVAYMTLGGELRLTWEGASGWEDVEISLPSGFSPRDVAVWVDGQVVMVAATGENRTEGVDDVVVAHLVAR